MDLFQKKTGSTVHQRIRTSVLGIKCLSASQAAHVWTAGQWRLSASKPADLGEPRPRHVNVNCFYEFLPRSAS
jgi:hypothetical protein